jgi:hypothetical protein
MLAENGKSLPSIVARQIQALEQDMERAIELHGRLSLIQDRLSSGGQPDMGEWLASLALMATCGKYFTAAELKKIFANWKQTEAEWQPLIASIRQAMAQGIAADSFEAQPLARRWMELSFRWMEGDFALLARWKEMCQKEPQAHGKSGIDAGLFGFVSKAIELRLSVLEKYLRPEELKRLRAVPEKEWIALSRDAEQLIRNHAPATSEPAQKLARQWSRMIDCVTDDDPVIREKLITAFRNEPLLQAGTAMSDTARDFIRRAWQALLVGQATLSMNASADAGSEHATLRRRRNNANGRKNGA